MNTNQTTEQRIAALMAEFGASREQVIDAAELAREELEEHGTPSSAEIIEETRQILKDSK